MALSFQFVLFFCHPIFKWKGPSHQSHNALYIYLTMHHPVTEKCPHGHISVTKLCIVGYGTSALQIFCNRSIAVHIYVTKLCIAGYRAGALWGLCRMSIEVHYNDVIMGAIASQITNLTAVYSIVYSDADQRKHQSSASLAFVRWIHRGPVKSPHKWPVTRKMFPFDDVIMGLNKMRAFLYCCHINGRQADIPRSLRYC